MSMAKRHTLPLTKAELEAAFEACSNYTTPSIRQQQAQSRTVHHIRAKLREINMIDKELAA